jgi:hypothetical protein
MRRIKLRLNQSKLLRDLSLLRPKELTLTESLSLSKMMLKIVSKEAIARTVKKLII